ncbi:hypothetical protein [Desulfobacula toluolica]|uniref:Uncharacterized protein n=1 Tax=Desulfobacula toluolica (strain DSM 7467 / Tol2) TaxID=651182 RepID=K0NTM8_DESTT|nr:hypothetical protein [Desulfobacula toluolica]CCK82432.1 uncharacterized protein TOL2_C42760 [Desulfobacula toluolica Tol2]
MNLFKITPKEAGILYRVLCGNDAGTMDPDRYYDADQLNRTFDKLRFVLMEIRDHEKMVCRHCRH